MAIEKYEDKSYTEECDRNFDASAYWRQEAYCCRKNISEIMKKLQNNFTTPEQSKRLLELGVPADSADCYFLSTDGITTWVRGVADKNMNWFGTIDRTPIPCWSVGRLIEIYYKVCIKPADPLQKWMNIEMGLYGLVEQMILRFVHDRDKLDFSKLEE